MAAFLGVLIRAGDEVFGNVYLAERNQGGEFTAEDEELLANMSRSAGRHGGTLQFTNPARRRQPADPDSPSADVKRL